MADLCEPYNLSVSGWIPPWTYGGYYNMRGHHGDEQVFRCFFSTQHLSIHNIFVLIHNIFEHTQHPHYSGPIQWARGDVGPPPRAPPSRHEEEHVGQLPYSFRVWALLSGLLLLLISSVMHIVVVAGCSCWFCYQLVCLFVVCFEVGFIMCPPA